jgi:predicted RNA binding protein YcfA (HicA-like mRNA interferase family)
LLDRSACLNLRRVDDQTACAAFGNLGFALDRIRGSYHVLKRLGHRLAQSVPVHGHKPLRAGTLRSLIAAADISIEAFNELVRWPSPEPIASEGKPIPARFPAGCGWSYNAG